MAVDQERGTQRKAGRHGLGIMDLELDEHESLPGGVIAFGISAELVKEGLLEFEKSLHVHAGDLRLGGGGGAVGQGDVFEIVLAGGKDGGALVDFGRIEEVEDGEVLDLEDFVHAVEAKTALAIQEIRDMGLFESGLLCETEPGEFACFNSVPKDLTEVLLQGLELHGRSIAPVLGHGR